MDLRLYKPTPLEQWIEQLYCQLGIVHPDQLNIQELAGKLNIWVYRLEMTSRVLETGGLFSMNLDCRLSPQEQWEDFLHELCHVLRHAGNQLVMPQEFTEMQENEANFFQLYAALPYFMLRDIPLAETEQETIAGWASEFGVTPALASLRLEQVQRRIEQARKDLALKAHSTSLAYRYSSETERLLNQLERQVAERKERYRV